MPTVPRYSERRVETTALRGGQRQAALTETAAGVGVERAKMGTAEAGARLGETLANVGAHFSALQERERKRANDVALMNAERQLGEWELKRIYDPEHGAYTVRGRDAMALPEQVQADFDQVSGEIERNLANDEQRAAFQKVKANRAVNIYGNVMRHVSQQMNTYHAEELQAKVENGIELATANALNPQRVDEEADLVVKAIRTGATAFGWGEEQTKKQIGDALTKIHVGVIESLLDNQQTTAAQEHFDEAKDLITDPKARSRIEGMLKQAGVTSQILGEADRIIAEGGDVDEQLEKAKRLKPEVRPGVEQRIEHFEARRKQAAAEADHAALAKAIGLVDSGVAVDNLPPTVLDKVQAHLPQLREQQARRARGEPNVTDQGTFYGLMTQAGDNPIAFSQVDLLSVRGKLSDSDFQQLAGLQLSIKNGNRGATAAVVDGFQTKQQMINAVLATYGIDPTPKEGTPEHAAIGHLYAMVDRRVQAAGGDKKVSNEELRTEVERILATKDTVPGSWWNIFPGGKPFFDQQKRLIDVTVDDIPASTRANVEEALRRLGRAVTPEAVREYYLEWRLRTQGQVRR